VCVCVCVCGDSWDKNGLAYIFLGLAGVVVDLCEVRHDANDRLSRSSTFLVINRGDVLAWVKLSVGPLLHNKSRGCSIGF
jgi:hypothetical protein